MVHISLIIRNIFWKHFYIKRNLAAANRAWSTLVIANSCGNVTMNRIISLSQSLLS